MRTSARTAGTARKILASLAVIGTAAAVAGLGTYGSFTDSTTPVSTTVETGTLSINLAQPGGAVAIPVSTANFVPGDSMSRAVTLKNDGTSALSSVTLAVATSGTANKLTTDTTNGLQLAVESCSVAWTPGGTAEAPTFTCSGTKTQLISKSVLGSAAVPSPSSLAAGGTDHLVFTVSLPTTADNTFQTLSSPLTLTFTGVQRNGTAR